MFLVILCSIFIIIARIPEAYRNAEQFEKPTDPRSVLWHRLKYIQFGSWYFAGSLHVSYLAFGIPPNSDITDSFLLSLIFVIVGLLIAWLVFNKLLWYFRRRLCS